MNECVLELEIFLMLTVLLQSHFAILFDQFLSCEIVKFVRAIQRQWWRTIEVPLMH